MRAVAAAAWLSCGCADMLGIPGDPRLVPPDEPLGEPTDASVQGSGVVPEPTLMVPVEAPDAASGGNGLGTDGVLPPGNVTGTGGSLAPDASANGPGAQQPEPPAVDIDAGALGRDAAAPQADAQECTGLLGRVPVDVVILFDNSGSMAAEALAFEAALPEFAARLDSDEVDYRIILLSRHRDTERDSSVEAATSVCIDAPLGVGPCPSASPVPTQRFFQYGIKIDATDSFARFIESFSEPDRFGLTESGWSERLRSDAGKVIIEISDADSSVSVNAFLDALRARDSRGLMSEAGRPNFVFHSIVGLAPKRVALAVYDANEPIESRTCSGDGGEPSNAGERYQALSRLTGGARLPVCPPSLLGARLSQLATDVALRSVRLCP